MDTDEKSPSHSKGWINTWDEKSNNGVVRAYPRMHLAESQKRNRKIILLRNFHHWVQRGWMQPEYSLITLVC